MYCDRLKLIIDIIQEDDEAAELSAKELEEAKKAAKELQAKQVSISLMILTQTDTFLFTG